MVIFRQRKKIVKLEILFKNKEKWLKIVIAICCLLLMLSVIVMTMWWNTERKDDNIVSQIVKNYNVTF